MSAVIAMANPAALALFNELKSFFGAENFNDVDILRQCLGIEKAKLQPSEGFHVTAAYNISQELAKHTLLVTIDCEHYTLNSDEMTEIGIGFIKTEEAARVSQEEAYGDHGENLMKLAQFHLLRLVEKSHLPTTNVKSKGPEGNRFGGSRFVTFNEAREILHDIMVQPIIGINELEGFNRPVIMLGHSLKNDRRHFKGKDLAFDVDTLGTVIREIDTQQITVDCKYWHNNTDPIGLPALVNKLEFQHTDAHTAANDAARTLMCAILMAVPKKARQNCRHSVQEVARAVEKYSQDNFKPLGGTPEYCCRCGSANHLAKACTAKGLRCDECVSRGLSELSQTHITLHCPVVRDEVALERNTWYKEQTLWTPKYPFSSRDRLQTFAPNAPKVQPATDEEVAQRRQWYDQRRTSEDNKLKPFVWSGRSFKNSPQSAAGPPPGSRPVFKSKSQHSRNASRSQGGSSGSILVATSRKPASRGFATTNDRGSHVRGRDGWHENTGDWNPETNHDAE